MRQAAERAAAHVARGVAHDGGQQTARFLFLTDEIPRFRQVEERLKRLLHRIERIVRRQPFGAGDPRERACMRAGEVGHPVDEALSPLMIGLETPRHDSQPRDLSSLKGTGVV